jgi:hypothetical protein
MLCGCHQVPARAAAAAAVARKIAALPPHERLSLTERPGSVYTTRPRGEPAEELEQVFYEDVCFLLASTDAISSGVGFEL